MSEEQAEGLQPEQEVEQVEQVEEVEQVEDAQEQEQTQSRLTPEDRARQNGWRPLDEFKGPKELWRSAEVFNERGEWIRKVQFQEDRLDKMEQSFNQRMENSNKLHQQQLDMQKSELVRKRDDAIDVADRETANKYQNDIDSLNVTPDQPANNSQSVIDDWNTSNQWIMGSDPKAAYGKQQFSNYLNQGMDAGTAIASMEADINRSFPDINTARENHPVPEKGTRPGRKAASKKLTMADLTFEEKKYYSALPGAWKSDADFLQAVQDTREGS